jgi:agmatine deiminase
MLYFSSLLKTDKSYKDVAEKFFATLDLFNIKYKLLNNTKDIWVRDFMPIITKSGKVISFRYEPCYLDDSKYKNLRTNFREDIAKELGFKNIIYSNINLDGGNVVFSPSKEKAIVSDRIFTENEDYTSARLVRELEDLLEARVIIIPSLKSDLTGHADGMVRFIDENTAIINRTNYKFGLEMQIKLALRHCGIEVFEFPYFNSKGISAVGCYLNFLETEDKIFLPIFDCDVDDDAISTARSLFNKEIIPVNINEIAKMGGVLNCISWEN